MAAGGYGGQLEGDAGRILRWVHDIAHVSRLGPPSSGLNRRGAERALTPALARCSLSGMLIAQVGTFYRYHEAKPNAVTALVSMRRFGT